MVSMAERLQAAQIEETSRAQLFARPSETSSAPSRHLGSIPSLTTARALFVLGGDLCHALALVMGYLKLGWAHHGIDLLKISP